MIALAAVACTSGDDDAPSATSAPTPSETPTGRSDGVTDDAIKIGVTYVDMAAVRAAGSTDLDHGDYEAAYRAVADDINANGGIHGRRLDLVIAPVDPLASAPAEEACLRLTEDEKVFLVAGFFLFDTVLCPLEAHQTAVVGGEITAERSTRAAAPWITNEVDGDLYEDVIEAFADRDLLEGKVAIFGVAQDEELFDEAKASLEELGVDVVAEGLLDSPEGDTEAGRSATLAIAERFEAARADTVLLVGVAGQGWPINVVPNSSYRPTMLFTTAIALQSYAKNEATTDVSVLEDAFAGGVYGPEQAAFEKRSTQRCIKVIEKATGKKVPSPKEAPSPGNVQHVAAVNACSTLALVKAWLEAAGETLNYGTLQAALDKGFDVDPDGVDPRRYGPGSAQDGDPRAYVFQWDKEQEELVVAK